MVTTGPAALHPDLQSAESSPRQVGPPNIESANDAVEDRVRSTIYGSTIWGRLLRSKLQLSK